MTLSVLRKCAFVLPAAALALALAGCKAGGGPDAPAKAQKAAWTPAAKVETAPAKVATLPPGVRRAPAIGDKSVWKQRGGKELAWKTVKLDGSIAEVHGSKRVQGRNRPVQLRAHAGLARLFRAHRFPEDREAGRPPVPACRGQYRVLVVQRPERQGEHLVRHEELQGGGNGQCHGPGRQFRRLSRDLQGKLGALRLLVRARAGVHGDILQGAAAGQEEQPLPPRARPSGAAGLTAPHSHGKPAKPRRVASGVFRPRFPFRRRRDIGSAVPRPSPGGERHVRPAGRPAHRGGVGLRGGAARRHGARPARRRRDPLRCARRRTRLPALAGDRQGRQPLLGRAQQGQAVLPRRYPQPARARTGAGADYRAGPGGRHFPDQPAGARLDRLRGALGPAGGPHPAECDRHAQRRPAGGLHRQRFGRFPLCHRTGRPRRPRQQRAPRLGYRDRHDRRRRPAGGRAPPGADGRGAG